MRGARERGFAYIAAIVFLVVLAGMALAMLRLQTTQQDTIDDAVLGMRAGQAARGGIEWGLYQMRSGQAQDCVAANGKTLSDFAKDTGFKVTVLCRTQAYQEGQDAAGASQTKHIVTLSAIACNGAGAACPDGAGATRRGYVERRRDVSFCVVPGAGTGGDCY